MSALVDYLGVDGSSGRLGRGLAVQARVVVALMMRDVMSRFGHDNLGFFWIIVEPMLLTCGVMVLWTLANQTHGSEIGVIPFALTGYSFITLWRHIIAKSIKCMTFNASLAFHPHVKFLDVLLARALIEVVAIFTAFLVAYAPLALLGYCPPIRDPLVLVGGYLFCAWFSFAFGLVLAGISELNETVEHVIQPALYLTLPLTGTFFMVDWLPEQAQQVLLWSPLVNACEMFRSGLFPLSTPTHYSVTYLTLTCLGLTTIGLPLCRYAQRHVQLL